MKPQIKTTSILTNIDNEFTKQSKHSRKKLFTAVPQCHYKVQITIMLIGVPYGISYDHYGFLAFFNIN